MSPGSELRSRIQYKIILPFLALTLLVAMLGADAALLAISGSARNRVNNQLAQIARTVNDTIVARERAQLAFLREVASASANPSSGTPALAAALAADDRRGLVQALAPYLVISRERGLSIDQFFVFNQSGTSIVNLRRLPADAAGASAGVVGEPFVPGAPIDLSQLQVTQLILAAQADTAGDTQVTLLIIGEQQYLITAAPVTYAGDVVGGLLLAVRLDTLLHALGGSAQATIVTVYNPQDGMAIASSLAPGSSLSELDASMDVIQAVGDLALGARQATFDTQLINGREYLMAYTPLVVRETMIGVISASIASDYVIGTWRDFQLPLAVLTILTMLAIILLGITMVRQSSWPLSMLVNTAQSVRHGDLNARSGRVSGDEVGVLAGSDTMTGRLLDLYREVQAEAGRRAAILESLADGVVVCDNDGHVEIINRTMRMLLNLPGDAPPPSWFAELPLTALGSAAPSFGQSSTTDLFALGERIVRVAVAPVLDNLGKNLGRVYVFHDMTDEVAIDRAKNNFIATISHELRTPLTVISGNADLLALGYVGAMNPDQHELIETMRNQTLAMTALINNTITIAGLDSGSLAFNTQPNHLGDIIEQALRSYRRALGEKGIVVSVCLPDDLPLVMTDAHHAINAMRQVIDNAYRYTDAGTIAITAEMIDTTTVQVGIADTGRGIALDQVDALFRRFSRGTGSTEGINSAQRGIGLGLAIARELVAQQGGSLRLERTSQAGSLFVFTLQALNVAHLASLPFHVAG